MTPIWKFAVRRRTVPFAIPMAANAIIAVVVLMGIAFGGWMLFRSAAHWSSFFRTRTML